MDPFSRYRKALQHALGGETRAYGFALVVWTTAALASAERGTPKQAAAIAYVAGALAAMAVVIIATFGGPTETIKRQPNVPQRAAGTVHLFSVAIAILAGWGLAAVLTTGWLAFLVAGFVSVLLYQLILGVEAAASERQHPE